MESRLQILIDAIRITTWQFRKLQASLRFILFFSCNVTGTSLSLDLCANFPTDLHSAESEVCRFFKLPTDSHLLKFVPHFSILTPLAGTWTLGTSIRAIINYKQLTVAEPKFGTSF
uniref:Uncharacterized protein n=1 Tax=Strigamia maritima TaxID=126957 RepID=T1J260_STRMM